jgi:hypothetical protein
MFFMINVALLMSDFRLYTFRKQMFYRRISSFFESISKVSSNNIVRLLTFSALKEKC